MLPDCQMLRWYWLYFSQNTAWATVGDYEAKANYTELYSKLSSIPLQSTDQVIDIVSSLCHSDERDGFNEGLKLGVRMGNELSA